MKISRPALKKPRIEMLPLIDIVFLVLVFFIYAMLSMAVHRSLPVSLPSSSTAEIDTRKIISITLKADQTVYLDNRMVSLDELAILLHEKSIKNKKAAVSLFVDRALTYQTIFNVLDIIKQSGLENISLQADDAP